MIPGMAAARVARVMSGSRRCPKPVCGPAGFPFQLQGDIYLVAYVLFKVGEHPTLTQQLELVGLVDPEWRAAGLMDGPVGQEDQVSVQAATDWSRFAVVGRSACLSRRRPDRDKNSDEAEHNERSHERLPPDDGYPRLPTVARPRPDWSSSPGQAPCRRTSVDASLHRSPSYRCCRPSRSQCCACRRTGLADGRRRRSW
jgi:hypothetical protein